MVPSPEALAVIAALGLEAHPEGGHYRQTWRDEAGTAIYFLLAAGERSAWHRVHGRAEVWHYYAGAPVLLELSADGETVSPARVGPDLDSGQRPQVVVPAGAWQSAVSEGTWSLVGCTVSPPFDFDHFELAPPGWAPEVGPAAPGS